MTDSHSSAGIHDVTTGLRSVWDVLFIGLVMCWCHLTNPGLVCVLACLGILLLFCICPGLVSPLLAFVRGPVVCVLWFSCSVSGPQCCSDTHVTNTHTLTVWFPGDASAKHLHCGLTPGGEETSRLLCKKCTASPMRHLRMLRIPPRHWPVHPWPLRVEESSDWLMMHFPAVATRGQGRVGMRCPWGEEGAVTDLCFV